MRDIRRFTGDRGNAASRIIGGVCASASGALAAMWPMASRVLRGLVAPLRHVGNAVLAWPAALHGEPVPVPVRARVGAPRGADRIRRLPRRDAAGGSCFP